MTTRHYLLAMIAATVLSGHTAFAQSAFVPLAPIPGLTQGVVANSEGLITFLENLYKYLVGLAAVLAIIEIIWGGFQISTTTDSVSQHSAGVERIKQAVGGLVLVLAPVLIFSIINPSILNLTVNIPPLNTVSGIRDFSSTKHFSNDSNAPIYTMSVIGKGFTNTGTFPSLSECISGAKESGRIDGITNLICTESTPNNPSSCQGTVPHIESGVTVYLCSSLTTSQGTAAQATSRAKTKLSTKTSLIAPVSCPKGGCPPYEKQCADVAPVGYALSGTPVVRCIKPDGITIDIDKFPPDCPSGENIKILCSYTPL